MKKPLPPTYFFGALHIMVLLHVAWPGRRYWGFPVNLVGLVPFTLGVILNVVADRQFKIHQTTVKPFEQSTSLIRAWPFSVTRNPIYLGMGLILFGVCLLLGTPLPFVCLVGFLFVIDRVFVRAEEQMLAATFGEDWDRYRSTVRRWL